MESELLSAQAEVPGCPKQLPSLKRARLPIMLCFCPPSPALFLASRLFESYHAQKNKSDPPWKEGLSASGLALTVLGASHTPCCPTYSSAAELGEAGMP